MFRNGAQIATSTLAAYNDANLTASTTYSYLVKAFDGAGNVSASSTVANATTTPGATWTLTASATLQATSGATTTLSNINIGTPTSDRIVVVGIDNAQSQSTTTSVAINGVSATEAVTNPNGKTSIWYASMATSTTASVVAHTTVTWPSLGIEVGTLTGVSATPFATGVHVQVLSSDPQTVTATVPANGVGVVFGGTVPASNPQIPSWADATANSYASSVSLNRQIFGAHTYYSGSVTSFSEQ